MPTIDYNTTPKTTPAQGYGGGFGMVSGFGSPFGGVIVKISSMLSEFEKTSYTDAQSDELVSTLIRVCQELRMTGERL